MAARPLGQEGVGQPLEAVAVLAFEGPDGRRPAERRRAEATGFGLARRLRGPGSRAKWGAGASSEGSAAGVREAVGP